MKKYMTPDFDVTVYEIKEEITVEVGGGDPDYDEGYGDGDFGGYGFGDVEV